MQHHFVVLIISTDSITLWAIRHAVYVAFCGGHGRLNLFYFTSASRGKRPRRDPTSDTNQTRP